jgi:hypothetical protein
MALIGFSISGVTDEFELRIALSSIYWSLTNLVLDLLVLTVRWWILASQAPSLERLGFHSALKPSQGILEIGTVEEKQFFFH